MISPYTSVVTWHLNPCGCGVARFSDQLALRLNVPLLSLLHHQEWGDRPLLSIKWAEIEDDARARAAVTGWQALRADQLWHDEPMIRRPLTTGKVVRLYRVGVPALVVPARLHEPALFTFGMAHKAQVGLFRALRRVLGGYQLWISTATHEGAGPSRVPELMAAWGDGARNLGTLTDDALGLVWPQVEALVAFFEGGLRANNTTVHAALDAGVPVITNHGADTPDDLRVVTVDWSDVGQVSWPRPERSPYTWDRLLGVLECVKPSSRVVA